MYIILLKQKIPPLKEINVEDVVITIYTNRGYNLD